MADIYSNRTDRCCVTQSKSNRVGVVRAKVFETNRVEDVAAIVEGHEAQSFLNGYWNAKFGVENDELTSSGRYANESACGRVGRIAAGRNSPLRACSV